LNLFFDINRAILNVQGCKMAGDEYELQVRDKQKTILETFPLSQFRESRNNYFCFYQFQYGSSDGIIHFDKYDEYGERDKNIYGVLGTADFDKMEQLLKEMPPIQVMTDFLDQQYQIQDKKWKAKRTGTEYKEIVKTLEEEEVDRKKVKFYKVCTETYEIIQWIYQMKQKYVDQSVFFVFITIPDY